MAPLTYYTDTSRIAKPWRPSNTYQSPVGQDPNQVQNDPVQTLMGQLAQRGQNTRPTEQSAQAASTFGAEIANKLGNRAAGQVGFSKNLQSMIPTEASTALAPGSQKGFSSGYLNQLSEITKRGQLATDVVRARNAFRAAQNAANSSSGGSLDLGNVKGARAKAIAAARSQLGVPYVWGGEKPGKGFDCSGLVQWAYARAGIRLPRVSQQQMTRGTRTSISKLKPGDLVGWGHPAHHIAIYLGGGRILEAPHTGANVRIMRLSQKGGGAWGIHLNI